MCKSLLQVQKNLPIVQYLVPFYKEKFVSNNEVVEWFRLYNYFNMKIKSRKKQENFVGAKFAPDTHASGVTLVGSGWPANYLKYMRWLNVKHRLIIELGKLWSYFKANFKF